MSGDAVREPGGYAAPLVHGEPVRVSRSVWVIADDRVPFVPNVGIVVGSRAALVVDTGMGAGNGAFVLDHARRLAGDRPLYLAITQLDPGHGFGAQAFAEEATIVYSRLQHDRLRREAPSYAEALRDLDAAVAGELDGLDLVEPHLIHDGELEIDLGGVRAVLTDWGPAHTADDQTVRIVDEVVFTGDLAETEMFAIVPYFPPFDTAFDLDRWITGLEQVLQWECPTVVPGHGQVTTPDTLHEVVMYLRWVRDETDRDRGAGTAEADAAARIDAVARGRWPRWDVPKWIPYLVRARYRSTGDHGRRPEGERT